MNHRLLLTAAVVACFVAAAPAAFAGPQLILNGGFDGGSTDGWTAFQTAAPDMADTVETNPSYVYGLPEYDGHVYNLEVNANYVDTVETTVSGLIVGDYYALSFGYGNRGSGGAQILDVLFGGQLVTVDTYNGTDAPSWTANSFLVQATATTEILAFASQYVDGSAPSYGNEIADVSLIPEPASLAVLAMGLTGLALVRRRRA